MMKLIVIFRIFAYSLKLLKNKRNLLYTREIQKVSYKSWFKRN